MRKRKFFFGSIVWHELSQKVNIQPLQELLNDQIDFTDYGDGIHKIHFTFIVVRPTNSNHQEEFNYDQPSRQLTVAIKLDYYQIKKVSGQHALEIMGSSFLKAIKNISTSDISDFDWAAFGRDVEYALGTNNLLEKAA